MSIALLDLPNELLGIVAFHLIDGVWNKDVRDFLSLTSACRRLHELSREEKYWHRMALRRDPTGEKPADVPTWFEYCRQIYLMRTIAPGDLVENVSRFDEGYFCTIEKIVLWPNKIRIFIDERGDYSLGEIQYPMSSGIAFSEPEADGLDRNARIRPTASQFIVADRLSQYLGYLDFPVHFSVSQRGKALLFQYGYSGYAAARLFILTEAFVEQFHLQPLLLSE